MAEKENKKTITMWKVYLIAILTTVIVMIPVVAVVSLFWLFPKVSIIATVFVIALYIFKFVLTNLSDKEIKNAI